MKWSIIKWSNIMVVPESLSKFQHSLSTLKFIKTLIWSFYSQVIFQNSVLFSKSRSTKNFKLQIIIRILKIKRLLLKIKEL